MTFWQTRPKDIFMCFFIKKNGYIKVFPLMSYKLKGQNTHDWAAHNAQVSNVRSPMSGVACHCHLSHITIAKSQSQNTPSAKGSNPEKKAASFRTLSKSGLDPPPVLDTCGVT